MATTTSRSDSTPLNGAETSVSTRTRSAASIAWSRFFRSKTAVAGLILVCGLILTALLADVIAPYSPYFVDASASLSPPSSTHLLGTDLLGRDMLSRILHGSRISLLVGFVSIFLALLVGVPLGLSAGFFGGKFDLIAMRFMDVILAFPFYLQAIVILVILGPSTTNAIIALGIERIPTFARLVRGSVLSIRELPYIEATQALSYSSMRIVPSRCPTAMADHRRRTFSTPLHYCRSDAQLWASAPQRHRWRT